MVMPVAAWTTLGAAALEPGLGSPAAAADLIVQPESCKSIFWGVYKLHHLCGPHLGIGGSSKSSQMHREYHAAAVLALNPTVHGATTAEQLEPALVSMQST